LRHAMPRTQLPLPPPLIFDA